MVVFDYSMSLRQSSTPFAVTIATSGLEINNYIQEAAP